ncbi:hypothetical protein ACLMJK_004835 [Lecanora helva]
MPLKRTLKSLWQKHRPPSLSKQNSHSKDPNASQTPLPDTKNQKASENNGVPYSFSNHELDEHAELDEVQAMINSPGPRLSNDHVHMDGDEEGGDGEGKQGGKGGEDMKFSINSNGEGCSKTFEYPDSPPGMAMGLAMSDDGDGRGKRDSNIASTAPSTPTTTTTTGVSTARTSWSSVPVSPKVGGESFINDSAGEKPNAEAGSVSSPKQRAKSVFDPSMRPYRGLQSSRIDWTKGKRKEKAVSTPGVTTNASASIPTSPTTAIDPNIPSWDFWNPKDGQDDEEQDEVSTWLPELGSTDGGELGPEERERRRTRTMSLVDDVMNGRGRAGSCAV